MDQRSPTQDYLSGKVYPLLELLALALIKERPADPVAFVSTYLTTIGDELRVKENNTIAMPVTPTIQPDEQATVEVSPPESSEQAISDVVVEPVENPVVVPPELVVSNPAIATLFSQVHSAGGPEQLGSPSAMSAGILSPSHSPRHVARYLSKGVRHSVPGQDADVILVVEKTEKERRRLMDYFGMSALFASVGQSADDKRFLIDALTREEYEGEGEEIELRDSFLLIEEGKVRAGPAVVYTHGNIIGKKGLYMIEVEVEEFVVTVERVVLWRLERNVYEQVVRQAAIARREKIINFVAPLFKTSRLSEVQLARLPDAVKEEEFPAYSEVVVEGQLGTTLFIVNDDNCLVGINDEDIIQYKPGDCFGQEAFAANEPLPYSVTVTTSTDTILFTVDRASFERMFGPISSKVL